MKKNIQHALKRPFLLKPFFFIEKKEDFFCPLTGADRGRGGGESEPNKQDYSPILLKYWG